MAGSGCVLSSLNNLEGKRLKGVTGEDGGRLVEGDMQGRAAAAHRVIVH